MIKPWMCRKIAIYRQYANIFISTRQWLMSWQSWQCAWERRWFQACIVELFIQCRQLLQGITYPLFTVRGKSGWYLPSCTWVARSVQLTKQYICWATSEANRDSRRKFEVDQIQFLFHWQQSAAFNQEIKKVIRTNNVWQSYESFKIRCQTIQPEISAVFQSIRECPNWHSYGP